MKGKGKREYEMVEATVYVQALITAGGALMGIWGFVKVLKDIKATNDKEVKWRSEVEKAMNTVNENARKWDKGLADVYSERETIVTRFDLKLKQLKDIVDEHHTEYEAKNQQLTAMMLLVMKSLNAILEREIKQGANGDVQKMHEELTNFLYEEVCK